MMDARTFLFHEQHRRNNINCGADGQDRVENSFFNSLPDWNHLTIELIHFNVSIFIHMELCLKNATVEELKHDCQS